MTGDTLPLPEGPLWVFGYGSLMWKPEFPFAERARARLHGYARRFCLASVTYRGTPERPGLVLGLDDGPSCTGIAYRIAPEDAPGVRRYLHDREMVTYAYREAWLPVETEPFGAHPAVTALCYVVDHAHPQYAGGLTLAQQAARIARCAGPMGPNAEYLFNTMAHLREIGVDEPELEDLERQVRAHLSAR